MEKSLQKKKDWVEITAPYLDRNNDYIQIYLKKDEEGYLLTDGGSTITGLIQEGCSLDTPKRQKLLQLTFNWSSKLAGKVRWLTRPTNLIFFVDFVLPLLTRKKPVNSSKILV